MNMKMQIIIEMDNDAFSDNPSFEVCRILEQLVSDMAGIPIEAGDTRSLRDINGNRVGTVIFSE
jgi:hypothetical protein